MGNEVKHVYKRKHFKQAKVHQKCAFVDSKYINILNVTSTACCEQFKISTRSIFSSQSLMLQCGSCWFDRLQLHFDLLAV